MQNNPPSRALWTPFSDTSSFKFVVSAFNSTVSKSRQKDVIESFSWMKYKGEIRMDNPDLEVGVLEDWPAPSSLKGHLRGVWIGKKVCLYDTNTIRKQV